jgi:hypothetical protein
MNEAGWAGLGVAATLLGILFAHRMGWIQINIMRQEHTLNLAKTTPKVSTLVRLEERKHSTHPVSTLVIITSIYNEGDLAASNLKGDWSLSCSESGFNRSIPISLDHLGNARPHEMETPFGSVATWLDVRAGKNITIEIDLKIRYIGLAEEGEKTYQAKYHYDPTHREFIRD